LATAIVICRRSADTSWLSLIGFIAYASIQEVDEDVDKQSSKRGALIRIRVIARIARFHTTR
jgi:hypothetical protein